MRVNRCPHARVPGHTLISGSHHSPLPPTPLALESMLICTQWTVSARSHSHRG